MPILLLDVHVLVQAIVYLLSVVCGLVMAIPLGVTQAKMKNRCLLYAEVEWKSIFKWSVTYGGGASCHFVISLAVFAGILYPTVKCAYYIYAVTRKDPNIGSRMWVLFPTLLSALNTCMFFIAACIISVGFKSFCDGFMKGRELHLPLKSCADAQKSHWYDLSDPSVTLDGSTFYYYIHASQIAAWIMFLVWLAQMGLGILRIVRNRRLHSQGMSADGGAGGVGGKPEDMKNVVAADPVT